MRETARIEFEDGHWWEVYPHLTMGGRLRLQRLGKQALKLKEDADLSGLTSESLNNVEAMLEYFDLDVAAIDELEMQVVTLEIGTAAWSWEEPVSREAILEREDRYTAPVLEYLERVYQQQDRAPLKKGLNGSLRR